MKKERDMWAYQGGRFISLIGSGIQMIAVPLYILDLTGSGALMGIFSVLTLLPALTAAPIAGIIGDRKNRKSVMVLMDTLRGTAISILGIIAAFSSLSIALLFAVQVLVSVMDSFFNSSSSALLPDLIDKEKLMEANSVKGGFDAAASILGPALGGVIYGLWGIKAVFLINGASFFVSALLTLMIVYRRKQIITKKMNSKLFIEQNAETLKYIRGNTGLLQLFSFAMVSNFLLSPMFDIIMPYALKKQIGFTSQQYGYIMGSFTAGILIGNILISMGLKPAKLKTMMKLGISIETVVNAAVCLLVFPYTVRAYGGATWPLFASIGAANVIMGISNAFVNTPIATNLQNLVPDRMRSRFFAVLGMFSQGAIPIGSLLLGLLLDMMKYYVLLSVVYILSVFAAVVFLTKASDEAYEAKPQID